MKPPFFIRWILRSRKQAFIHQPMRAGVKIPGIAGGTLATEPVPVDEAVGRYKRVMARLKSECQLSSTRSSGRSLTTSGSRST